MSISGGFCVATSLSKVTEGFTPTSRKTWGTKVGKNTIQVLNASFSRKRVHTRLANGCLMGSWWFTLLGISYEKYISFIGYEIVNQTTNHLAMISSKG